MLNNKNKKFKNLQLNFKKGIDKLRQHCYNKDRFRTPNDKERCKIRNDYGN